MNAYPATRLCSADIQRLLLACVANDHTLPVQPLFARLPALARRRYLTARALQRTALTLSPGKGRFGV